MESKPLGGSFEEALRRLCFYLGNGSRRLGRLGIVFPTLSVYSHESKNKLFDPLGQISYLVLKMLESEQRVGEGLREGSRGMGSLRGEGGTRE